MSTVRLAPDFFRKERAQAYSDWESAFWRELFQNSIDQNASRIDITIGNEPGPEPGTTWVRPDVRVTFTDNGPGMPRDVLENVYFAIGATTKNDANSIGGMGRARILTCFAMAAYRIDSCDYYVKGSGGDYHVFDSTEWFHGCKLAIDVDASTVENMEKKLKEFLSESSISATITLNGNRVSWEAPRRGRYVKDLVIENDNGATVPFARVYVNKSAPNHRLIVRVHGVSMFTTDISAKAQVVVELNPEISRVALTSNRDSLRGDYRWALNAFLRQLSVDTQSAIKDRFERRTTVVDGGGMRTVAKAAPKQKKAKQASGAVVEPVAQQERDPFENHRFTSTGGTETVVHQQVIMDDFGSWLRRTFGDIFIYDETESTKVHKVVPNYLPSSWQIQEFYSGSWKKFRKGGNIIKVLLMWQTAMHYAVECALERLGRTSLPCSVGFVFKDGTIAVHRGANGGHVFCINPVNAEGKLDYAVRNRQSLKRMMSSAKHEATHIAHQYHDEDFSALREAIDEIFDESECLRRMKTALDAVPDLGEEEWRMAA